MRRLLAVSFFFGLFLSSDGAEEDVLAYHLEFPQAHYEILLGREFQVPVQMRPLPTAGLFSYGVVTTVKGSNGLVGVVTMNPMPPLSFDGILGPGTRGVIAVAGSFSGKGSVDIFLPEKPNHTDPTIGTVSVAGLPEGTYTLALAPYNTLGITESIFVDGLCRSLDPDLDFGTATLTIVSRPEGVLAALGPMRPDRQTGLLLQEYELKNTGSVAAIFRILIRNLPVGTQVWNAHGSADGVSYVDLPQSLAPGGTTRLTIEYRSQDRTTVPRPEFEMTMANPPVLDPIGLTFNLQPRLRLAGGDVLLEFNSETDKNYYIQYSSESQVWRTALPKVVGTGNRIQWIDNGSPKTENHPSTVTSRLYRILETEPSLK